MPMTGTPAHDLGYQAVMCLPPKRFTFADNGKVITLGTIPAGSVLLKANSGVHVKTVFNAGTSNTLNIGYSLPLPADDDYYGTLLALGAANFVPLDETVGNYVTDVEVTITATVVLTGTTATTGDAAIVISYIAPTPPR